MEFLSTTSLANELDIPASDLFNTFSTLGWIERKDNKWALTKLGEQQGAQRRFNQKYGEYIVWPQNINLDVSLRAKAKYQNATTLGKHFKVSSQRLNLILSELGWIEKSISGWEVTKLGKRVGGKQFEHEVSGAAYVLWPNTIINDKNLCDAFSTTKIEKDSRFANESNSNENQIVSNNFRDKFEAKHRTKDGHFVRSRAEVIIDDTLYDYELVHSYEKKLPVEEDVYTDFYIPKGKVYIEYWGMENDPKYLERKKAKLEIYRKYDLKLIELTDDDILNLDDHLPKKLLKFGIKVY